MEENRSLQPDTVLSGILAVQPLLDSLGQELSLLDTNMRYLWVSSSIAGRLGKRRENLVGRTCHSLHHSSDSPCAGCPVREALVTGETRERVIISNGKVFLSRGIPVKDESGTVCAVFECERDITLEKEKEKIGAEVRMIRSLLRDMLQARKQRSAGPKAPSLSAGRLTASSIVQARKVANRRK